MESSQPKVDESPESVDESHEILVPGEFMGPRGIFF